MDTKTFIFFFHIYQPPWQDRSVLHEMYETSYLPLLELIENNPDLKITLNFCGSLTEQMVKEGMTDYIERVRKLVRNGQIELVGSAMYHPILALIPEEEVVRQIRLNEEYNSKYFGDEWSLAKTRYGMRGFFMPELAYSPHVGEIIKNEGFDWTSVDLTTYTFDYNIDYNKLYKSNPSEIITLFRNPNFFVEETHEKVIKDNDYVVVVSDGEYVLNKDKKEIIWIDELKSKIKNIKYATVGEYLNKVKDKVEIVTPGPGNWQMTKEAYDRKSYYDLWIRPDEKIQNDLWDYINQIIDVVSKNKEDKNYEYVQKSLDKALSSCTWWWVDGRVNGYNPSIAATGLNEMINTIRTFEKLDISKRLFFEKRYSEILYSIWEKHWKNMNKLT